MPLYDEYHNGGLAEYVRVPHWLVDKLPDSVSFDVAAKVHDLANALRTVKCANLEFGSTIVVTAATGTMGSATVKLAEHLGVGRMILVGRNAERLAAVAQLSGSVPVDTLSFSDLPEDWVQTGGLTRRLREMAPEGIDGVIDYLTDHAEGVSQAMMATAQGGTLVHMGGNLVPIAIPPLLMMTNCWRFVGTRGISRERRHADPAHARQWRPRCRRADHTPVPADRNGAGCRSHPAAGGTHVDDGDQPVTTQPAAARRPVAAAAEPWSTRWSGPR